MFKALSAAVIALSLIAGPVLAEGVMNAPAAGKGATATVLTPKAKVAVHKSHKHVAKKAIAKKHLAKKHIVKKHLGKKHFAHKHIAKKHLAKKHSVKSAI
jgi:hypothetical protein